MKLFYEAVGIVLTEVIDTSWSIHLLDGPIELTFANGSEIIFILERVGNNKPLLQAVLIKPAFLIEDFFIVIIMVELSQVIGF